MDLSDDKIIVLLKRLIPKERIADAAVFLDTQIKKQGQPVSIGRKQYPMPFTGYLVFVDLMPVANWGHPALAIFVSEEGDNVTSIDIEFPSFFGEPPANYRKLVLDSDV